MNTLNRSIVAVFLLATIAAGCSKDQTPTQKVSFETRETVTVPAVDRRANAIRIAVGGMITPEEGFGYYRQFLDYLGDTLGMKAEFVDRSDYGQINKLIRNGNVDLGFVCSGPYVDGHRDFGMELLVAPQAYGAAVYYSYIIVPRDSPAWSLKDLRNGRFAFTDPLSNTGALVPTYMLSKMKETPSSFFRKVIYTQTHDKSIKLVAENLIEGAAVDSLIYEYLNKTKPGLIGRTRIILKSPPYGIPPVVVHPRMDPAFKQRLRDAFLNAHANEKGAAILKGMMIDRFVIIRDSDYNSVREMKRWVAEQQSRQGTR